MCNSAVDVALQKDGQSWFGPSGPHVDMSSRDGLSVNFVLFATCQLAANSRCMGLRCLRMYNIIASARPG